ncbi:helix-turn-helix transcriptional regulator [Kocuria sabuli]|uniref:AraC family transcriptional regulator n=1 Tax=Kocuria sabuli TaxID=3071448 RepID=UPI0034D6F7EC
MSGQVRRSSWITRDPEAGCAVLERTYRHLRMNRPVPTSFDMSLAMAEIGPLGVQQVRLAGFRAAATNDGTGLIRIGHLTQGRFSVHTRGRQVPGSAAFLFPPGPYAGDWEDLGMTTLTLDHAVVLEHARALLGRDDFHLHFTGHYPVTPAMGAYWQAAVRHVLQNAVPNDSAMASPLLRTELVRSVTAALLCTFPSTFLEHPDPEPSQGAHPVAVRRAQAFIDAHLAEPLTLAQIAVAARVSPRGLQELFRRHLDTAPLHYLRAARLDAARQDLLRADPATGVTVTAIAAQWGFPHPGRFAAYYRQVYGEPPATTLHR